MDDTISRQAAIDAIRKCSVKEVTPAFMLVDKAEVMTEFMMLPSAQPELATDCISKQSVIDAITDENIIRNMDSVMDSEMNRVKRSVHRIIASIPSAQPEIKTGWDLISRPAAIEEVCNMMRECFGADDEILDALKTTLNELTAIYPERKTGRNAEEEMNYKASIEARKMLKEGE